MRKLVFLFSLVFVGLLACGEGDQGEACDEEGKVDGECDDGLVCGKKSDTSSDLVCLKQCSSDADCGGGEQCNGTANSSLKGCRAKTGR